MDEGYAQFITGRFRQTLEYRPDKFLSSLAPAPSSPIGGFLMSLMLGLPALRPNAGDVETWAERPSGCHTAGRQ